jgi:hypothetical protein
MAAWPRSGYRVAVLERLEPLASSPLAYVVVVVLGLL